MAKVLGVDSKDMLDLEEEHQRILADEAQRAYLVEQRGTATPVTPRDRETMLAALAESSLALVYAAPELRSDREVALAAVEKDGRALAFVSEELRDDHEIVAAALKSSRYALQWASEDIRGDESAACFACKSDGAAVEFVSHGLTESGRLAETARRVMEAADADRFAEVTPGGSLARMVLEPDHPLIQLQQQQQEEEEDRAYYEDDCNAAPECLCVPS